MNDIKYVTLAIITLILFTFCMASCNKNAAPIPTQNNDSNNNPIGSKMKITVGTAVFTATLQDNPTATAFKAMLPLTINMSELNGNEKFFYFSTALPTNAASGGNIKVGDLMLYGNNCLVLFYESFNTSYSYTRLGQIDDTPGLAAALGAGSVTVKLELE